MAELADSLTVTVEERLDQAEAAVRGYCEWHIAPSRSDTVTVEASFSDILLLPTMHLTAVSSVTEDGRTVAPSDYRLDERGWLKRTSGRWTVGPIVVTMTHGHLTVPPDVTGVVQSFAQRAIDGGSGAVSWSRTDGPFSDSYNYGSAARGAFTPNEREVLDRYALPPEA